MLCFGGGILEWHENSQGPIYFHLIIGEQGRGPTGWNQSISWKLTVWDGKRKMKGASRCGLWQRLDEGGLDPKDIRCSNLGYCLFV